MTCPMCQRVMGCSCDLRTSRDGLKRGCSQCIRGYEEQWDRDHDQQQIQQTSSKAYQMIRNIQATLVSGPR